MGDGEGVALPATVGRVRVRTGGQVLRLRHFATVPPTTPPTVPSSTPGRIIITEKTKTAPRPPLPGIAAIVCASWRIARRAAAPVMLIAAPNTAVATPAQVPAANDRDRHEAPSPAARRMPTPRPVDTADRM